MRELALAAIGVYQRYVSPYKGFCCAYRVHTGRAGCSALGARVIRRYGLLAGSVLLRQRLRRCGEVHRQVHPSGQRPLAAQRGDCDLDCTPDCDGPCDNDKRGCGLSRLSAALDCCDCCSCDWPDRKRKDRPPARKRRGSQALRWDELADSARSRRRDP